MGGIWEIENCTRVWFLAADWFVFFFKRKWMCYALKENSSFMFFFGLLPKNVPKKLSFYSFLFFFFCGVGWGDFFWRPIWFHFSSALSFTQWKMVFWLFQKKRKWKWKTSSWIEGGARSTKEKKKLSNRPYAFWNDTFGRIGSSHDILHLLFWRTLLLWIIYVKKKLKKKEQHVASHDRISLQRTHKRRAHTFGRQGNEGARESRNF